MKKRFSHLYEELRLQSGRPVFLYPAFFLLRRLILAFAVVVCYEYLIAQIYLVWAQCIIALLIIEFARPFNTQSERRMEIFNEINLMLVLYTMMCFTPLVPSIETRLLIGWVACGLVASHLFINLSIMLRSSIIGAKHDCRMKSLRKQYLKTRKAHQQRLRKSHPKRLKRLVDLLHEARKERAEAALEEDSNSSSSSSFSS